MKKQLTPQQQEDINGFLWVVLNVNPFISTKELYKKTLHFAKSKKMPLKAVRDYLKECD